MRSMIRYLLVNIISRLVPMAVVTMVIHTVFTMYPNDVALRATT